MRIPTTRRIDAPVSHVLRAFADVEPEDNDLPGDQLMHMNERMTMVPQIASTTLVTRPRMSQLAAENLEAVLAGGDSPDCLNPEVLQGA